MGEKYIVKHDPIYDRVEISPGPFTESERQVGKSVLFLFAAVIIPPLLLLLLLADKGRDTPWRRRVEALPDERRYAYYTLFTIASLPFFVCALLLLSGNVGDIFGIVALIYAAALIGGAYVALPYFEEDTLSADTRRISSRNESDGGSTWKCPRCGVKNPPVSMGCANCGQVRAPETSVGDDPTTFAVSQTKTSSDQKCANCGRPAAQYSALCPICSRTGAPVHARQEPSTLSRLTSPLTSSTIGPDPQKAGTPPVAAGSAATTSVADQLEKLGQLHSQGVLDDEEFRRAKRVLLETMTS